MLDVEPLGSAAWVLADMAREVRDAGLRLEHIDLGGGLGIGYDGSAHGSPAEYASAVLPAVRETGLHLLLEPGRFLTAPAGILVGRVADTKAYAGCPRFVILDTGMTELIRPMLYDAFHRIVAVAPRAGELQDCEVVGPLCETSDTLGHEREFGPVEVDDLVAVLDAGAYGIVMASNYNRRRDAGRGDGRWRRPGAWCAGGRRLTTCCPRGVKSSIHERTPHRLRRPRPERQGDPGPAPGPVVRIAGRRSSRSAFPDYTTTIGQEIWKGLHGEREFGPDMIQLLLMANRHEWKPKIQEWLAAGRVVICDRYLASSVAYGEAQGLDPHWLLSVQAYLPQPDVTVLLDIAPGVAAARKRRTATSSRATCRCSGACGRATCARPTNWTGSWSTRPAPSRWWPSTSLARSRRDSGYGKRADLARARGDAAPARTRPAWRRSCSRRRPARR